jgi:Bax protein
MLPRFLTVYVSLLFAAFAFDNTKNQNSVSWNKILEESPDRKQTFVNMLLPVINEQNQKILKDREFVETFFDQYPNTYSDAKISAADYSKLVDIASTYKVGNIFDKKEYFDKIDIIPASLVLSQAALESGWGSSRVSLKSNNLFGQKSFGNKNYIKAAGTSGVKYAAFESIGDAVKSYMTNLNSHEAYGEFRKKRADTRRKNIEFTGLKAAKTLINYSEVQGYTTMLSQMIKSYFSVYDEAKNIIGSTAAVKIGFIH